MQHIVWLVQYISAFIWELIPAQCFSVYLYVHDNEIQNSVLAAPSPQHSNHTKHKFFMSSSNIYICILSYKFSYYILRLDYMTYCHMFLNRIIEYSLHINTYIHMFIQIFKSVVHLRVPYCVAVYETHSSRKPTKSRLLVRRNGFMW